VAERALFPGASEKEQRSEIFVLCPATQGIFHCDLERRSIPFLSECHQKHKEHGHRRWDAQGMGMCSVCCGGIAVDPQTDSDDDLCCGGVAVLFALFGNMRLILLVVLFGEDLLSSSLRGKGRQFDSECII